MKSISTAAYRKFRIIRMYGSIKKYANGKYGVLLDDCENPKSKEGLFWLKSGELNFINNEENEMEDVMTGTNKVAIVNLLEDYSKKDYGFALFDSEWMLMKQEEYRVKPNTLVVVNAKSKDNRVLGIVKEVMSLEDYGKTVTAQVVGVVNMDGYIERLDEENRVKELVKKKAALEKELEAEINKRKSIEYYEEMAKKYSDNPKLAELVAELRELGM